MRRRRTAICVYLANVLASLAAVTVSVAMQIKQAVDAVRLDAPVSVDPILVVGFATWLATGVLSGVALAGWRPR